MWCYFVFYTNLKIDLQRTNENYFGILIFLKRKNECVSPSPVSPFYSETNKYYFFLDTF